ncbi:transcription factor bHLH113-like isoform X7 [Argentina anserina]|uniref:transcription factor bHLH113-like isoform X7 n=1 Tax=Argentina anserina TaxID=57926 RepID=UPI0021766B90|nr:transcription factor bHLH113-like isoform X7 [Potentilla anserina]
MADKEGSEVDQLGVTEGTSFSQLLFEVENDVVGLRVNDHHHQNQIFNYTNTNTNTCSSLYSAADLKSPKMLCFGDFHENDDSNNLHLGEFGFPEISVSRPAQNSGLTCSESSSVSSTTTAKAALSSSKSNSNKKRNGVAQEQVQCAKEENTQAGQRSSKKRRTDKPAAAKREKLGERISALQQLVSPFGKTDTASVLHEAMGYIRFLHDQVQVLCSPYLQRLPSLSPEGRDGAEKKGSHDLRSRGLCLVPTDYTTHVANNNGADYWSSAGGK